MQFQRQVDGGDLEVEDGAINPMLALAVRVVGLGDVLTAMVARRIIGSGECMLSMNSHIPAPL